MAKQKKHMRRRDFVKLAAATAALPAARYAKILGANDRVRVVRAIESGDASP